MFESLKNELSISDQQFKEELRDTVIVLQTSKLDSKMKDVTNLPGSLNPNSIDLETLQEMKSVNEKLDEAK